MMLFCSFYSSLPCIHVVDRKRKFCTKCVFWYGRRKGGGRGDLAPWILKFDIFEEHFQQKKVVFLVSRGKNEISSFYLPTGKSLRHPCLLLPMFTAVHVHCCPCLLLSMFTAVLLFFEAQSYKKMCSLLLSHALAHCRTVH